MTNEQIKQAATDFAEREYEISDIDKDPLHKGFYHGALWRINSVWHDKKKEPKQNEWFIAQIDNDCFDTFVMQIKSERWEKWCKGMNIMRWAYVSDLLPDGKEDCK